jgi:exopolysaccharide biosynthesis protein
MKRLFFITLIVLGGFGLLFWTHQKTNTETKVAPDSEITGTQIPSPTEKIISVNSDNYAYTIIGPVSPLSISLIGNLPKKQMTKELLQSNNCNQLVNGGFYDTNDHYLGLFETDGIVHSEQSRNSLLNGLFWTTTEGKTGIGTMLPDTNLIFALQTGPTLIENGLPRVLRITNDESARRMIAGVTKENTIFFIALYDTDSIYSGPLLGSVPKLVDTISKKEKLGITDAINLDGGNHSAMITKERQITEFSPVGSGFCIK